MRERAAWNWATAAAGVLLAATAVTLVLAGTWSAARSDVFDGAIWRSAVAGAATVTALASAGLLAMWWRTQLVASALWWSLVMVIIGVHAAIGFIAVLAEPGSLTPFVETINASVVGLAAFFSIKAVRSAQIDLAITPSRVVPVAIGISAFVGLISWITASDWVVLAAWSWVAVVVLRYGLRRRDTLAGWLSVGVLGVIHHQAVGLDSSPDAIVAVSSGVILELSLIMMLLGVFLHIEQAHADLERRLFAADAQAHHLKVTRQAGLNESEHRLHEARSALAAMEQVTRLLPLHAGAIPLRAALRSEVSVLRRLVTPGPAVLRQFRVADALAGTIAVERMYGVDVRVHVPAQLEAFGDLSVTAEAAQCLLENARIYAEGSPIEVAARRRGDEVHISISDNGPGIAPELVGRLFERGFTAGVGSGLGLGIAKTIMEQQGGRLWRDEEVASGARFVLALPSSGTPDGANEVDDVPRSADRGGPTPSASIHDGGASRRVVEGDRDIGI